MRKNSLDGWIAKYANLSENYSKFGDFLDVQKKLLKSIDNSFNNNKPMAIFVAPPASGKTHIICVLAEYLQPNHSVAIITPSNYLKQEFLKERENIKGRLKNVDFLNLSEYLKTEKKYDYALIDEAHNLKSIIELDPNLVKTISFSRDQQLYDELLEFLPTDKSFIAKQISFTSSKEFLNKLKFLKSNKNFKEIFTSPTSWKTFVFVGKNYEVNHIKFLNSDLSPYVKLPRKKLLLFSATALSDEELIVYCGIDKNNIFRAKPIVATSDWKKKQRFYVGIKDEIQEENKISFLHHLFEQIQLKTLVLFNNSTNCLKYFNSFKNNERVFCIPNDFDENKSIYDDFVKKDNGILFTPSNIFWEGITIAGLQLLVIVDIPYPHPHLFDLLDRKVFDNERGMIRRLEQGVGRIGRKKGDFGVGIFLFRTQNLRKWLNDFAKSENYEEEYSWNLSVKCKQILQDLQRSIDS